MAPWAARNPDNVVPNVTVGNVKELVSETGSNPDLSYSLLKKIQDTVDGANANDTAVLQSAALGAAANATGLGPVILNQAGDIINALSDNDKAQDLIVKTLNDMQHLEDTGSILTAVLPEPDTPEFTAFVEQASADDLAIAAAVLLAGQAKQQGDSGSYLSNFDPG
ncbi:MAG TPA: hypothetical protein DEQ14_11970, partial [Treponema sp.]|nr:hypothetical protein [Treponema sp.]